MPKKLFYCSLFEKHKSDIKKTWLNIKEILTKKEVTKGYPEIFTINGKQASEARALLAKLSSVALSGCVAK